MVNEMASVTQAQPEFKELSKRTFRFDWVVSLLLALTLMALASVGWLGAVWLTNRVWKVHAPAVGVEIIEIALDAEEGKAGDDPELGEGQLIMPSDMPAREENLTFDQPQVAEVMSNVLDAIAEHEADFADPSRQEGKKASGRPGAPGGTGKEGTGEGSSAIPRSQRWSIIYPSSQTLESYARQLDFFGIELGVVRGGRISYVTNLVGGRPVVKAGGPDSERLYFVWQDPARRDADRKLLQRANIPLDNSIVAQFFPAPLEETLARLERAFANKKPEEIRLTQFGIRRKGSGHEFFVQKQTYVR